MPSSKISAQGAAGCSVRDIRHVSNWQLKNLYCSAKFSKAKTSHLFLLTGIKFQTTVVRSVAYVLAGVALFSAALFLMGSSLILWQIWRNDGRSAALSCVLSLTIEERPSRFILAASLRPAGIAGSDSSICFGSSIQACIICIMHPGNLQMPVITCIIYHDDIVCIRYHETMDADWKVLIQTAVVHTFLISSRCKLLYIQDCKLCKQVRTDTRHIRNCSRFYLCCLQKEHRCCANSELETKRIHSVLFCLISNIDYLELIHIIERLLSGHHLPQGHAIAAKNCHCQRDSSLRCVFRSDFTEMMSTFIMMNA